MGYTTIEEGQQALIFNREGRGRLVIGPRRVSLSHLRVAEYLNKP